MSSSITTIAIDKFVAHPDNPNRMSKAAFAKLVRNIKRTGRYEPLIVRPDPTKGESGFFQIINGHHRWLALKQLGYKTADSVVWDIDDQQTEIFLATLNRLTGSDVLDKKLRLLKKLTERMPVTELGKILPQSSRQLQRLMNLKLPSVPANADLWLVPIVFFVDHVQQKIIEEALTQAISIRQRRTQRNNLEKKAAPAKPGLIPAFGGPPKQPPADAGASLSPRKGGAVLRAAALTNIAQSYLDTGY
jgi:ParB/RepB/Spo0J family partition protein